MDITELLPSPNMIILYYTSLGQDYSVFLHLLWFDDT